MHDSVKHPSHYCVGNFECKKVFKALCRDIAGLSGAVIWMWGNAFKYLWRWARKNGVEDLKKCRECIDDMISELESEQNSHPWADPYPRISER